MLDSKSEARLSTPRLQKDQQVGRSSLTSYPTNEIVSQSSTTTEPSTYDAKPRPPIAERHKSSVGAMLDKAKAKLSRKPSGVDNLPDDEEDFERQKAKETEKQKRREEYERLGLGDRTKYGMGGNPWGGYRFVR